MGASSSESDGVDPITLRGARPTLEEGEAFATYLDIAADGAFRAMLGRRVGEIVAEAFTTPGHDLSFERVVFAEHGGSIVGMASGYTAEEHRQSTDAPLRRAAGLRFHRMSLIAAVGRSLFTFIHTVPEGDFYLQTVAVDDQQRGFGIGSKLLDHMEERARAAGSRRFVLDVVENNADAQQLYERRGMTVEAESNRVLFIPGTRARRMVKSL